MDPEAPQGQPAPTPEQTAETPGAQQTDSAQTTAEPELTEEEKQAKELDKQNRKQARGVQKRLDELTRNWRDAQRDAEYWREMAMRGQPQQQQTAQDGEPKESDYKDYAKFLEDRAAWRVKQELAQHERQRSEERQRMQLAETAEAARDRLMKGVEKYDDFEEVAFRADVPISEAMFHAMAESDVIADIAYHLGQNPEEAQRIARMSPWAAAREIGRIEANLAKMPVPKVTSAPPPARVVKTTTVPPGSIEDPKLTIDEWMKRRNKQVREASG